MEQATIVRSNFAPVKLTLVCGHTVVVPAPKSQHKAGDLFKCIECPATGSGKVSRRKVKAVELIVPMPVETAVDPEPVPAAKPAKVTQTVDFYRNGKRIGNFDNRLSGLAWLCSANINGQGSPRIGTKEFVPILEQITGLTRDQLISQPWGPAILPNGIVLHANLKEGN